MMTTRILELGEVGAGDVARVGGKGASLGELLRAGVDVPGGFVLDAATYRAAVAEAKLWPRIERALAGAGVAEGDAVACDAASRAIRPLFEGLWLGELDAPLEARLAPLGAVAVRSSATAEDLPDASFAGQQETFLGVRGLAAVKEAIAKCWASLWTARAISYRARQGYEQAEVALAVVVQEMVAPDVAGVLFTIDPVSGRKDEMLLDASYGLGEAVVSGMVTPDSFRLGRKGKLVREFRLGSKERRIDATLEGGTRTTDVSPSDRARPCLDDASLHAIAALGERAEAHYGTPQDLEFALCDGRAVLLQSRPITTRAEAPPRYGRLQRRTLDDILEHYPAPPLPLDEVAVVDGYEALQKTLRLGGLRLPHAREVLRMDDDGVCRVRPPPLRVGLAALGVPVVLRHAWRRDPDDWRSVADALEPSVSGAPPGELGDTALLSRLRDALSLATAIADARFSSVLLPMALWGAWLAVLTRLARHPVDPFDWLGGLSYETVQVERALQEVADQAMAHPDVRALYLERPPTEVVARLADTKGSDAVGAALERLMTEHGARTAKMYVPFSTESWSEDATPVHALVAAMVRAAAPGAAKARFEAATAKYEAVREAVQRRLPRFLRATFVSTLDRYRRAHVEREASLYAIERTLRAARLAARELGRRLAARGLLAAASHVVYARFEELESATTGAPSDLRRRVARRRARRELAVASWRAQRPVSDATSDEALRGVAGSPGAAEGPVRLVLDVGDFGKLQAGDVLVCPYTDPTWTPLFALAAAVVADTGGPLSHAAIVAREYGIPAVLGTESGTRSLRDGERVAVDGRAGTVHRIGAAATGDDRPT